jgi:hypothetical protein
MMDGRSESGLRHWSMSKGLPVVLIALVLLAAACGSNPAATVRQGTIEIRRDVPTSTLLRDVIGIKRGSTSAAVRAAFGAPFAKVPGAPRETCWAYHAHQAGNDSIDALDFCIRAQRVRRLLIGVHA